MTNHTADLKQISAIIASQSTDRKEVEAKINKFDDYFDEKKGGEGKRKGEYTTMVNSFYDLVTDFYEYGWGQSFHFAPRHRFESFEQSLSRHEMYLAHMINLKEGMTCLDVGSGVGGPARQIALFSRGKIVGLNNNDYQIKRATKLAEEAGLSNTVSFKKGDFLHIPAADNSYDAAYSIEATCHAPELVKVYKEIFRVLKPGQMYGTYEWLMTEKYDERNAEHNSIKQRIEHGNSLPNMVRIPEAIAAMKEAGFEVVEHRDLAEEGDVPWYAPFTTVTFDLKGLGASKVGRAITSSTLYLLETLRIAPKGICSVQTMLCIGADSLEDGGKSGIFTPCYFILARKPLN
jgi:sterol 24-C-methyltransferase